MTTNQNKALTTATYESRRSLYKALQTEAIFEIESALRAENLKYHSVIGRVKELDSLLAKMESRQIQDPFEEVPDIVGARIVALFLSDIDKIIEVLGKVFDIEKVDNKIQDTDPRLFGYFSVHLIAKIKASYSGTRYDQIKQFRFEIQIRTIAMDAWASASHYLDYKSETDVPADLRRDFNALSGLYYVADKHFEMFFRSRAANLKRIDRLSKDSGTLLNRELNLDTLLAFLRDRYPDREPPEASDASDLLSEIRAQSISSLAELNSRLDANENWFRKYEKRFPPWADIPASEQDVYREVQNTELGDSMNSSGGNAPYAATGAVRISLNIHSMAEKTLA